MCDLGQRLGQSDLWMNIGFSLAQQTHCPAATGIPSDVVKAVIRTTEPIVGYYSDEHGRPAAITVPAGCIGELDPYDWGTSAHVVLVHENQDVTVPNARPEQYRPA